MPEVPTNEWSIYWGSLRFRYAPVYPVGALEYTALVWAAIWGYLLFHDVPAVVVIIGAAIVVTSGLGVVLREHNKPS